MKFEKFFKNAGTYGQIVTNTDGDKWLVCAGVGMLIPAGLWPMFGDGSAKGKARMYVNALTAAWDADAVVLARAYLGKDDKPSDVLRVFSDGKNEVAIRNKDFALLERSDVFLFWTDVDDDTDSDTVTTTRFLLIQDNDEKVIGFIQGIDPAGQF